MSHIEIFGHAASPSFQEAESFCARMGYPHLMRDVGQDLDAKADFGQRKIRPGFLPQIFIGAEQIGGLRDLINMAPFTVQQLIGQ
jgi:hypothetical protein